MIKRFLILFFLSSSFCFAYKDIFSIFDFEPINSYYDENLNFWETNKDSSLTFYYTPSRSLDYIIFRRRYQSQEGLNTYYRYYNYFSKLFFDIKTYPLRTVQNYQLLYSVFSDDKSKVVLAFSQRLRSSDSLLLVFYFLN